MRTTNHFSCIGPKTLFRFLLLLLMLLPVTALGVPSILSHQGRMMGSNGDPIGGVSNVTFAIYTSATGGSALWSQELSVTFDDGYYSATLGTNDELANTINDSSDLYLGIQLEGQEEFAPRVKLNSVPYAIKAGIAESVEGSLTIEDNASEGYVLTSDSDGNGTWQAPSGDTLSELECGNSQVAQWNGSNWVCANSGSIPIAESEPTCDENSAGTMWFSTNNGENTFYGCNGSVWVMLGDPIPENPANLAVDQISNNSATLVWDIVEHATNYKVYASLDDDSYDLKGQTDQTQHRVTDLEAETEYYFQVRASSQSGTSGPSNTVSATTLADIYGSGDDGPLTITEPFDLNTDHSGTRSKADGIAYQVSSDPTGSTTFTTATPALGLAEGDIALLINLQGTNSDHDDVGNYELVFIEGVNNNIITLTSSPTKSYTGDSFSDQKVVIQRTPQYSAVTVADGGKITVSAWDGLTDHSGSVYTGIVAFLVREQLEVGGDGIDVSQKGFIGGQSGGSGAQDYQGTVSSGGGDGQNGFDGGATTDRRGGNGGAGTGGGAGGQGDGAGLSGGSGGTAGAGGGGGGGTNGAGGGGGGAPHDGGANNTGSDFAKVYLGGGGANGAGGGAGGTRSNNYPGEGGKANGDYGSPTGSGGNQGVRGGSGGNGANGGGIILVFAYNTIGSGTITANGGNGGAGGGGGGAGHDSGGGGAGAGGQGAAGGSIYIQTDSQGINTDNITTDPGSGGGGAGGGGGGASGGGGGGGAGPDGGGGGAGGSNPGGVGGDAGQPGGHGSYNRTMGGQFPGGGGGSSSTGTRGAPNSGGIGYTSSNCSHTNGYDANGRDAGDGGCSHSGQGAGGGGGAQANDGNTGAILIIAP